MQAQVGIEVMLSMLLSMLVLLLALHSYLSVRPLISATESTLARAASAAGAYVSGLLP